MRASGATGNKKCVVIAKESVLGKSVKRVSGRNEG
jgi:hypothetical protein